MTAAHEEGGGADVMLCGAASHKILDVHSPMQYIYMGDKFTIPLSPRLRQMDNLVGNGVMFPKGVWSGCHLSPPTFTPKIVSNTGLVKPVLWTFGGHQSPTEFPYEECTGSSGLELRF